MKNNNLVMVVIVAVVAIAAVGIFAVANNNGNMRDENMMSNSNSSEQPINSLFDKNSSDYKMYNGLTGDSYDRMFIVNMIEHHKGAVDMAKLAQTNAKHQELKIMAENIISTQSKEITNMESWQTAWNYPSSSGDMMMDHSAVDMMADMGQMEESLKSLTGDEFDKTFLASMIKHHQSAINMAYPGQTNAKHGEVKELTKAIIKAQSGEIAQMKQWQKDWGYTY